MKGAICLSNNLRRSSIEGVNQLRLIDFSEMHGTKGILMEQPVKFDLDNINANVSQWSTIKAPAEGEGQYIRQTAGPGHYAQIKLLIEPYRGVSQLLLEWYVTDDEIPTAYIPAIIQGIQRSAQQERPGHGPIINVKVKVQEGQHHIIDSQPSSFTVAAARAFEDALSKTEIINFESF